MSVFFSIITPTYNCQEKIPKTLESVLNQSFEDLEYIFVDGSSSDGTSELLSQIQDRRVHVLSEPDSGIYDAMNKGVKQARGTYLYFLGAGDLLCPDALMKVRDRIQGNSPGLLYGDVFWNNTVYDGRFSKKKLGIQNICHQAIFYHKNTFKLLGLFDLKYKLLADWEFNMRCFGEKQVGIVYAPVVVAIYEDGGKSDEDDLAFENDRKMLILRNLGCRIYYLNQVILLQRLMGFKLLSLRRAVAKLVRGMTSVRSLGASKPRKD